MPVYEYKAVDEAGKTVNGIIDADSLPAARGKLRDLGLHPTKVKASDEAAATTDGEAGGGILYSCGPEGMVRAMERKAASGFERHFTSLESVMACGVGACRGCTVPVKTDSGSVLRAICSDGTVFDASEIDWERWEE